MTSSLSFIRKRGLLIRYANKMGRFIKYTNGFALIHNGYIVIAHYYKRNALRMV